MWSGSLLKCSQCASILCLNSLNTVSTAASNSSPSDRLSLLRCLLHKGLLLLFARRAVSLPFHLLNSSVSTTVGESYPLWSQRGARRWRCADTDPTGLCWARRSEVSRVVPSSGRAASGHRAGGQAGGGALRTRTRCGWASPLLRHGLAPLGWGFWSQGSGLSGFCSP